MIEPEKIYIITDKDSISAIAEDIKKHLPNYFAYLLYEGNKIGDSQIFGILYSFDNRNTQKSIKERFRRNFFHRDKIIVTISRKEFVSPTAIKTNKIIKL